MIEEFTADADERMGKTIEAMQAAFARIRTGRAHPSLLDGIEVPYYGSDAPLNQVASISVEDARTLLVSPWERSLVPAIQKAILKSDLGITPAATQDVVRLPLPALTEENRRELARQARQEAEAARIAIRNIRRDAISDIRELLREKEVAQDDARRGEEAVQQVTDRRVKEVDQALEAKEADLMAV
ncbi:MAG: ribosome recycling factor [Gammaproteobacteria bacterium]|nr:ribosome recycling factor [Gammaproteobacteria bacterium]MDE0273873.1 ribosome recycling factor [Gammaproteobacteria bacterium]